MSRRLEDKVCVINGAASAIGQSVAKRLADEGALVIGVDISSHAVGSLSLLADLTDEEQVQDMYAAVFKKCGRLDVVYNNMGFQDRADHSIVDTDLGTWEHVQTANVTSTFLCCKHAVPCLLKNSPSGGSIINSASFLATIGAATAQMAYSAAKASVVQMTRDLGINLARSGVRVNAVCFGPIETPAQKAIFDRNPGSLEKRLVHWPMGRFGSLDEAAGTIAFLASDDSGFITAAAIPLDGGITAAFTVPD